MDHVFHNRPLRPGQPGYDSTDEGHLTPRQWLIGCGTFAVPVAGIALLAAASSMLSKCQQQEPQFTQAQTLQLNALYQGMLHGELSAKIRMPNGVEVLPLDHLSPAAAEEIRNVMGHGSGDQSSDITIYRRDNGEKLCTVRMTYPLIAQLAQQHQPIAPEQITRARNLQDYATACGVSPNQMHLGMQVEDHGLLQYAGQLALQRPWTVDAAIQGDGSVKTSFRG